MKKLFLLIIISFSMQLSAQDIQNTLGTSGNFVIKDASSTFFYLPQSSGLIGLGGVTSPRAQMEIGGTEGLLVTGTYGSGTSLSLGAGARLHWYPKKGAFRAGVAETTYWDDSNIGNYSIAMGYYSRATASYSVAFGRQNYATGQSSLALGAYCQATANYSTAIGYDNWATGLNSVVIGQGLSSNGKEGAVLIGDNTQFYRAYASQDNQLTMRFNGGYRLWTSYPDSTAGVYMRHGQSGWSNYCDRNMKENFEPVNGELVLQKIKNTPVTTWNYKKTDTNERYMGPVAQDFYTAFRLNGTDSLGINSISMDGVNFAGVKALEERTSDLIQRMEKVEKQNEELLKENINLKEQIALISRLKNELEDIAKFKSELIEKNKFAAKHSKADKKKNQNVTALLKQRISRF